MIGKIVFTPRVKFALALIAILGAASIGIWVERSQQAREDLKTSEKNLESSEKGAEKLDTTLAEKISTESKAQQEIGSIFQEKREAKSEDELYREYLDRPLPDRTLRLYERAGKVVYTPAGVDGADGKRSKEDRGAKD